MESSVEKLEGLAHKLTVEVPAEQIDQSVLKELKTLRPKVRIDGFRPGKVPPEVVKKRYGEGVRQDILSKEINTAMQKAFEEHDYTPVATPEIKLISGFKEKENLKFEANFEIMPEVEVKGVSELAITLPEASVTEENATEMLETLRRQQATYEETTEAAQKDDRITVDFTGIVDGEAFEGSTGSDVAITVAAGQMLPEFDAAIEGMKAGETKTFDVTFPENYQAEDLRGKTAQFTATAKKVEKAILPEITEEFIKGFGTSATDIDAFKAAIKANMERELNLALGRIRRERLFDGILEKNSDQIVPKSAVHQEMERMAKQMNLAEQIKDKEQLHQLMHQLFEPQAEKQVRLGFLIGKLFEDYQLTLDKDRVEAKLNDIASTYESPEDVKNWYRSDKEAKANLESSVLEEQLIDKIYENVTTSSETLGFQEVMQINNQIQN